MKMEEETRLDSNPGVNQDARAQETPAGKSPVLNATEGATRQKAFSIGLSLNLRA